MGKVRPQTTKNIRAPFKHATASGQTQQYQATSEEPAIVSTTSNGQPFQAIKNNIVNLNLTAGSQFSINENYQSFTNMAPINKRPPPKQPY
jgi:hypothetical protein